MKAFEVIIANGHENILAKNKHTFEITKESHLTKRGDCIIAVAANKGISDLSGDFKKLLRREGAKVKIVIQTANEKEVVEAWGDPKLRLNHPTDLVIRKSDYICNRTLAINADKAAKDFSRLHVKKLKNSRQKIQVILSIEYVPRLNTRF